MASNGSSEGKKKNRRIEFQHITIDEEVPNEALLVIPDEMKGYLRFRAQF